MPFVLPSGDRTRMRRGGKRRSRCKSDGINEFNVILASRYRHAKEPMRLCRIVKDRAMRRWIVTGLE